LGERVDSPDQATVPDLCDLPSGGRRKHPVKWLHADHREILELSRAIGVTKRLLPARKSRPVNFIGNIMPR
jgi:hypothetical protein